jgi:dihydroorotate dehydrogenase (fumarate)
LNGANQIDKMISYLNNYLIKNNLDSISQIKGLLKQENIKNPALFERIQFMKYFSDHDDVL